MTGSAKQSVEPQRKSGLLRRGVYHRAALRADPLAPRNDGKVESPKVLMSHAPRFHRLALNDLRPESADAVSRTLAIPEALAGAYRFAPGRYLPLRTTTDVE